MANEGWERPRSAGTGSSISGTLLWEPLSVLVGEQHSQSSMLEGLFISVLTISCNAKLAGRDSMMPTDIPFCALVRRGQLTAPKLQETPTLLLTCLHSCRVYMSCSTLPLRMFEDTT